MYEKALEGWILPIRVLSVQGYRCWLHSVPLNVVVTFVKAVVTGGTIVVETVI